MATRYADRLQAVHPSGPYSLLGWSLGGVIAHEVAIELCRRGCEVRRLMLLDAVPDGNNNLTKEQVFGTMGESYVLELMLGYLHISNPEPSKPLTYEHAEKLIHHQIPLPIAQLRIFLKFFRIAFGIKWSTLPEYFMAIWSYFTTTQSESGWDLSLQWRPYVTGEITEYPVDCQYLEMLSPESIEMVWRATQTFIRTVAKLALGRLEHPRPCCRQPPASTISFSAFGVAVDPAGDVYVADAGDSGW
jgi:hypothetical protein